MQHSRRTKVQQSKFRDGRHHADLVLSLSLSLSLYPTNSALNEVKLVSIDPELPRRMDLTFKIFILPQAAA